MNKDIRVLTTFPRHPKTIKLKRMLGTWEPIIVLWLWAAENKPSGKLDGLEADDICIAAGWDGDCEELISALASVKFIEKKDSAYVLHGWREHNAFAADADRRIEQARLAARARWDRKLKHCSNDADSNANAMLSSNAPSPSPSPSPNPNKKKRACAWPSDFCLDKTKMSYLVAQGVNEHKLNDWWIDFEDWAKSKNAVYVDWEAAFRTRARKTSEYGKQFMSSEVNYNERSEIERKAKRELDKTQELLARIRQ